MRPVREIFRSYALTDDNGRHIGGCDKETNHRYGDAYESLFPEREDVELMMEIGVADGSSLIAWSEVFPSALCVGLDIHPAARLIHATPPKERIEFYLGNMRRRVDCLRAAGGRVFDFICEDASHSFDDTLCCLLYLWPRVKPGGLYVIEEFADLGNLWDHLEVLLPFVEFVETVNPFGGTEYLTVLRKPR